MLWTLASNSDVNIAWTHVTLKGKCDQKIVLKYPVYVVMSINVVRLLY